MNPPASREKRRRRKLLMPLMFWALEEAAVPGGEPDVARRRKWQSSMDTCAVRQWELRKTCSTAIADEFFLQLKPHVRPCGASCWGGIRVMFIPTECPRQKLGPGVLREK
ncbi:SH2 domain-containing protein 1A isoform X7 [Anas acuta]|uniref:SH2 domain-containing protein 1A isoform X7 n=1 Tax=Anas acuta TaxID=28680 RepID=UPI0035C90BD3